jgi:hypothetical protein
MDQRWRRVLRLPVVALYLAAWALGSFSTTAGAASGTALPRVMTCAGTAVVQPTSYTIACGDGNSYLSQLHWTLWVAGGARATGTFTENDCTPYCAAGKFVSHAAKVSLSRARGTRHGYLYTRLTLSYRAADKVQHVATTLPIAPL